MTNEELDALVHNLRTKCPYPAAGSPVVIRLLRNAAITITTLRAELDKARAGLKLFQDLDEISVDKVAAETARADKAEASLAAQAEALGFARLLIDTGWSESDGYRLTYHTSVTMKVMSVLDAAIAAILALVDKKDAAK